MKPFDATGVLIVGAGHFGKRAVRTIRDAHPDRQIVMADRDDRSGSIEIPGVEFVRGDAVDVLDQVPRRSPRMVDRPGGARPPSL